MNLKKIISHVITKGLHLLLVIFFLIWIAYTALPLILWASEFIKPLSWVLKVPIFVFSTIVVCILSIIGGLPLFWLDKVKEKKIGWIGDLYKEIED